MTYEKSLWRLNLLKGHVNPGVDSERERSTATFDLDHARQKLWATLPESYFETFECLSEIKGISNTLSYSTGKFFGIFIAYRCPKRYCETENKRTVLNLDKQDA